MKMFTVQVARDRTEYVTVKVRAEDRDGAEEAALREVDGLSGGVWQPGADTDGTYVVEISE